jgi:hypothetical protein
MKNYTALLFIGLVSSSLVLSSCDQKTRHRKLITNNSDYDLIIFMGDSVFVGKHSEVAIYDLDEFRRIKSFKSCSVYTPIQSVIVDPDSLNLTIDLNNQSNWQFHVVRKELSGYGECECKLEITNAHIQ